MSWEWPSWDVQENREKTYQSREGIIIGSRKKLEETKKNIGTLSWQEAKKETEKLLTTAQIEEARKYLVQIGYADNLGKNWFTRELQQVYQDFQTRFGRRYPLLLDIARDKSGNTIPSMSSYYGIIWPYGLSLLKIEAESFDQNKWPKYSFLEDYKKIPSKKIWASQVISATVFRPQKEHVQILKSLFPQYDNSPIPMYVFAQIKGENIKGERSWFHISSKIFGFKRVNDRMSWTRDAIFINKNVINNRTGYAIEHVILNEAVHYLQYLYPDRLNEKKILQKTLSINGKNIPLPKSIVEVGEFESDIASACVSWESFVSVYRRLQGWFKRNPQSNKIRHIEYSFSYAVFEEFGWLVSNKLWTQPPLSPEEENIWMTFIRKTLLELHKKLLYWTNQHISIP